MKSGLPELRSLEGSNMSGLKRWYRVSLIFWALIVLPALALAIYAAGWRIALYGFLFHVDTDNWFEIAFGVLEKLINYFPLVAAPFAFGESRRSHAPTP